MGQRRGQRRPFLDFLYPILVLQLLLSYEAAAWDLSRPPPWGRRRQHLLATTSGTNANGAANDVTTVTDLVRMLHRSPDPLWDLIQFEGRVAAAADAQASAVLHGEVLSQGGLNDALSALLANKLDSPFVSATELHTLLTDMYDAAPELRFVVAEDALAHAMRDPSIPDALTVLLFHKGFHSLESYRLTHWLWRGGREQLARCLQSVVSETLSADIHPGARVGRAVYVAGGTNVVVGETAEVGDDVCVLQGVTLGGTGKERGDRHPKVQRGALIGAGAAVLGNIAIGEGCRVEAGSVVVKPIEPYTINRGVPSKTVDYFQCRADDLDGAKDGHRMIYIKYQARKYSGM